MDCPYCGGEMKQGYLQSSRPVLWSPKKKKMFMVPSSREDFEVTSGFWNGCFAEAHFCEACDKVIVSVQE